MNIQMTFKHMHSQEPIREYAREKTGRLNKYFNGRITVNWNFTFEGDTAIAHCHVLGKNIDYFAQCESESLTASIDLVIEKIERQVRRHKEIVRDHLHSSKGVKQKAA